jgi:ubiquinone biosynthesis monooxygenase Coq7
MLDRIIIELDKALRTLLAEPRSVRPHPGEELDDAELQARDKRHAAALMRVNHCGEICAQALYNGQALTSRDEETTAALRQAALEETEHLAWCQQRIRELGGRTSMLNPLWYGGSFALGAAAGALGKRWNLGFLAETERQVGWHLTKHLARLPEHDAKSRAVLVQMHADETAHADNAVRHGAAELPRPVKAAMRRASRIMTETAYYL